MSTTDLRSFLTSAGGRRVPPGTALSVLREITALQHALDAARRYPVICVARPVLADGRECAIPVVCNLTASRELTARALGFPDHRAAARCFAERIGNPVAPLVVRRDQAPVQAVVQQGDACDMTQLPVLTQHTLDPAPTSPRPRHDIRSGNRDRQYGDPALLGQGPRRTSYYAYAQSHNDRNVRKFWARGEACPIAFWIGHHPAVSIAAQAKLDYPQSHWARSGA